MFDPHLPSGPNQMQGCLLPPEELHLSSVVVGNGLVLADLSLWSGDIQTGIVNPERNKQSTTVQPAPLHRPPGPPLTMNVLARGSSSHVRATVVKYRIVLFVLEHWTGVGRPRPPPC